ncbi:hypothetical protein E8F11_26475 [Pseudomonas sp. BN417]|uniref:hypothetical protein n=1 Tax=Pseudomonas sp. BN417 TaxID=2567890 RepID=UPI00245496D9|nr:hypothetical protein [Pseudomonas sp. BN417]MDH4558672.1 hypothetical protein [Pseudomonas sp. BN417]
MKRHAQGVILEIEYRLDPAREDYSERLERRLRAQPGLISSHCERSDDGSRVLYRAQWEPMEAGQAGLQVLDEPLCSSAIKALRFFA